MKIKKHKVIIFITIILVLIGGGSIIGILGMQRYLDNFCINSNGGFRSFDQVKKEYDGLPLWMQKYFIERTKKNLESENLNQRYKALISLHFLVRSGLTSRVSATIGYKLDMLSSEEEMLRDFRYGVFIFGDTYRISDVIISSQMAQKHLDFLFAGLNYNLTHTDSGRALFFPCLVGLMSANRNDARKIQDFITPLLKTDDTRKRRFIYATLVRCRVANWDQILEKTIQAEPDKELKETFTDILHKYKLEKDKYATEQDFLFSDGIFSPFEYENEKR